MQLKVSISALYIKLFFPPLMANVKRGMQERIELYPALANLPESKFSYILASEASRAESRVYIQRYPSNKEPARSVMLLGTFSNDYGRV